MILAPDFSPFQLSRSAFKCPSYRREKLAFFAYSAFRQRSQIKSFGRKQNVPDDPFSARLSL